MENVVLTVHLIVTMLLIGIVLLQRSEGGGLGMGGGGGGATSGRSAVTALAKLTWVFAVAFICTSITLTVIAAQKSAGGSVIDQFGGTARTQEAPATPNAADLLPPVPADAPLAPPRPDAAPEPTPPATPPNN